MRNGFLYNVAEAYYRNKGDNIRNFCFVFPNRRSSLFFLKYLGEVAGKALFSPPTTTINSFFGALSGLKQVDRISSIYKLYLSYTKFMKNNVAETFDDFVFWGDMILNDFDDIDKYLVDSQKLFKNISDLQQLNVGYDFLTKTQRDAIKMFWGNFKAEFRNEISFLSLWEQLYNIYNDFCSVLKESGEGYEGMIYRDVVEKSLLSPDVILNAVNRYEKVVFVGLNALNECEKSILNFLKREGKADFYWDYYGDIIKDEHNKSSLFMKSNEKEYPSVYKIENQESLDNEREVEVIGIPSSVGQAKYLKTILDEIYPNESTVGDKAISTAIVLPDENLLQSVVNSIPEKIDKVNVTMGCSLKTTELASFMSLVCELFSKRKYKVEGDNVSFYHTVVKRLLSHPYMLKCFEDGAAELKDRIVSNNHIYVPCSLLQTDNLLGAIFNRERIISLVSEKSISAMADYQLYILQELNRYADSFDKEFVLAYYKSINRLKEMCLPIEYDTYFSLLNSIISSVTVPFNGEPLSGLQIMGPLETRALDFENVIILSVNEGKFPSASVSASFIPYNLRKGFGLPNYEFQDSISAYHFYRSIYRAKRVFLLYDTRGEGIGKSGEASRYIMQLEYHHKVPINKKFISYNLSLSDDRILRVDKTDEMMTQLKNNRNFSASSLNSYLDCKLKFYFKEVEGLKEEEDVVEDVESNTFGTLFHDVMQTIYKPYRGKIVNKSEIDRIINDELFIKKIIAESFAKSINVRTITGQNLIIEALLLRYVKKVLQSDSASAPFQYIESEKPCYLKIDTKAGKVMLNGYIDRIDRVNGALRIIDYKTGGYNVSNSTDIDKIFDRDNKNRPYTALQMLLYQYLMQGIGAIDEEDDVVMMILSVQDLFKGKSISFSANKEIMERFGESLKSLIEEILDKKIPFVANPKNDKCKFCPFIIICNRHA